MIMSAAKASWHPTAKLPCGGWSKDWRGGSHERGFSLQGRLAGHAANRRGGSTIFLTTLPDVAEVMMGKASRQAPQGQPCGSRSKYVWM